MDSFTVFDVFLDLVLYSPVFYISPIGRYSIGMGFLLFFVVFSKSYPQIAQVIHKRFVHFLRLFYIFYVFLAFFTKITVFSSSFTARFDVLLRCFTVSFPGEHGEQTKDILYLAVSIC